MYYNIFDSHSHSENSPDGVHSVTSMAEAAISKGVQGLVITDHCEADRFEEQEVEKRILQSALDVSKARAAFGSGLILSFGIEVGQVFYNQQAVENLMAGYDFDFVISSLHRLIYEKFDFSRADYSEISAKKLEEYMTKYFEEFIDMMKWENFDIVGHLCYPALSIRRSVSGARADPA